MSGFKLATAGVGSAAVAFCMMMGVLAMPAQADDGAVAAPAPADVHATLDQAIEHQKSRRSAAITGMVIGGIAVVGGSIDSAVASGQNQDEKNQGRSTTHNPYVGYAVGLGVGLPILGISAYFFSDAQHQINLLRRERLSVSYSPDTHQPVLQLSLGF